jgi:hypothetical protein
MTELPAPGVQVLEGVDHDAAVLEVLAHAGVEEATREDELPEAGDEFFLRSLGRFGRRGAISP